MKLFFVFFAGGLKPDNSVGIMYSFHGVAMVIAILL